MSGSALDLYALRVGAAPASKDNPVPTADVASVATCGATSIAGDTNVDIAPASTVPRRVVLTNRGGGDATIDVDADATGADAELKLYPGQTRTLFGGARFTQRVSVFAINATWIEWEICS